uniref:2-oxoacid dehydrogenase acyltransferase catalytic domain-containing protein n=1 Tax=Hemiselmis andersenii TaxID=464988 RepID=A0A6U2BPW1_HEMAN
MQHGLGVVSRPVRAAARTLGSSAMGRGMASAAAVLPHGVLVAPSARILLAGNTSLAVETLAKAALGRMPNGHTVVTKADVLVALGLAPPEKTVPKPAVPAPTAPPPATPAATPSTGGAASSPAASSPSGPRASIRSKAHRSHEDIPTTQMRKIIAKRLLESKNQLPHQYMTVEVEMDNLIKARVEYNERSGNKVSVNDFIIKACASALEQVPEANAYWTPESLKFHPTIDVAFAAATPAGLVTPVVRGADKKTLAEIAKVTKDLAGRARENKLLPEEFQGGSLSVSNLGMFAITEFVAVLNPPQSAIFAIGSTVSKAVMGLDGVLGTKQSMMVTLSHDARVMDAALAKKLCTTLKALIQTPALIFMG